MLQLGSARSTSPSKLGSIPMLCANGSWETWRLGLPEHADGPAQSLAQACHTASSVPVHGL